MATKLISFASDGARASVASGDKLVVRSRHISGESYISIAVFPAAGATARVFFTHDDLAKVAANPDDSSIKWLAWANGEYV